MKTNKISVVIQFLQNCFYIGVAIVATLFLMRFFKWNWLTKNSVYAFLLYFTIVKTRSIFSRACSKKMTTIVMENAIYVISLRFLAISNIH
jgi:hypothetical protein